jgi:multimeric flavodoxin WrbA
MNILVLNGDPDAKQTGFNRYVNELCATLDSRGHIVKVVELRRRTLNQCVGCYSCWLKTPGRCIFHDDVEEILRAYLMSELVILASPVLVGFTSALLKRFMERTHPLALPFLYFKDGRMQHVPRYDKYPKLALLLEASERLDARTMDTIDAVYKSGKTRIFAFEATTAKKPSEVADEIDNSKRFA